MDQTASRGSFYPRVPSCTQQRVTGRVNPNPNPNSLYAKAQTCVAQTRSSQFSRGAFQLSSGHPTCPSSSKRGYLTRYRILPAPCSCQRKHSSTQHCPLQAVRGSENATQQHGGGQERGTLPPGPLRTSGSSPASQPPHPPCRSWAAIKTSPLLPVLKPSLPSSPLNHLPSIDNSTNCWCFTKYMLRHSFKENPHSCTQ